MLSRKKLVPLKKEFSRIRREAKNYDSPAFGLLVTYGSQEPQAAFLVSKKVHKSSVVRHDIKRKLSDAIEPFLPRMSKNVELVFLAKQKSVESSRDELKKEIQTILQRAGLVSS
ncbi:ribonuclease P protein component [Candidatus Microgenomates bacterium]|nr:ribonuclease P protein component [Candidatus Microgenomates bacterium]